MCKTLHKMETWMFCFLNTPFLHTSAIHVDQKCSQSPAAEHSLHLFGHFFIWQVWLWEEITGNTRRWTDSDSKQERQTDNCAETCIQTPQNKINRDRHCYMLVSLKSYTNMTYFVKAGKYLFLGPM